MLICNAAHATPHLISAAPSAALRRGGARGWTTTSDVIAAPQNAERGRVRLRLPALSPFDKVRLHFFVLGHIFRCLLLLLLRLLPKKEEGGTGSASETC